MTENYSTSYPPGSNRRLIDWVRSPSAFIQKCSAPGCKETKGIRRTPEGNFCLGCYLNLLKCEDPDCHKPALSGLENGTRSLSECMGACRIHHYIDEKSITDLQREFLERGQSHSAGYIYPG